MQLIQAPALILTRNPAEVVFKIPSALKTEGSYASAVYIIESANYPIATDTWLIEFGDYSLPFVFGTADGIDPLILDVMPGVSYPDDFNTLVKQLYRHPDISKNFTVEIIGVISSATCIHFKARKRGDAYSLTSTTSFTLNGASIENPAVDDEYYSSLDIVMRVYDNDIVTLLGELKGTGIVNADGNEMKVTFHDLPELLNPHLENDIPQQPINLHYSKSLNYFHIEVFERSEGALRPMQVEFFSDFAAEGMEDSLPAIKAGFPLEMFAASSFNNYKASTSRKFLTWQSRSKLITYEQPEWLSLYFLASGAYRKKFVLHYSDNTTATHYVNFDVTEPSIIHIPSGATQNDLNSVTVGKTIVWFDFSVQLVSGPVNTSEVFTYVIDSRYQRNHRYFVFVNSLGGCDTIRCFGVKEFTRNFSRVATDTAIDSNSRMNTGSMEMVYNELEQIFTLRTGWQQDKATIDYYTDLLRTNMAQEVVMPLQAANYQQPMKQLILLNDKVNYPTDADFGYAMEFSMKYGWKDTQYSNAVAAAEVFYDTFIELRVDIAELLTGTPSFVLGVNVGCVIVAEMNGVAQTFVSTLLAITAPGSYTFKFKAYNCTAFSFSVQDATSDFVMTNYETRTVQVLSLVSTRHLNYYYLTERTSRLRFVETLFLATSDEIKEPLIIFCQKLLIDYSRLSNLNISDVAGTLSSRGLLVKDYLDTNGVVVYY